MAASNVPAGVPAFGPRAHRFCLILMVWALLQAVPAQAELPKLGDAASATISLREEEKLGKAWVRVLRAQAPLLDAPQIQDYLWSLLQELSNYSRLPQSSLTLVLLAQPSLNAFAAPGGIIGVNAGLLLHAHKEGELASVLAHELAHLSQRHYAEGLARQQNQRPWQMLSTLASILLMASSDGQAGTAALLSSQAAFKQRQLAFSRTNEKEADRIGMHTLASAGFDPATMPALFQRMHQASRLSSQPPELLLTHPVTESRIADALNRAAQLADGGRRDSLSYRLMRTRARVLLENQPEHSLEFFRAAREGDPSAANRYGVAFSALQGGKLEEARRALESLLEERPDDYHYRLLKAEYLSTAERHAEALALLQGLRELYPDHLAPGRLLAEAYHQAGQPGEEARVLEKLSRQYPDNPALWEALAEARGLAGDRLGLRLARAEYFLLHGGVKQAREQLELALSQEDLSAAQKSRIRLRLEDTEQIAKDLEF